MQNRSILLLLLVLMIGTEPASGAFEYPSGSVKSFAKAGCVNLHKPSPLDLYIDPALRILGKIGVDLSLSRLYNMSDFQLVSGAASLDRKTFSLTVGSTQLTGSDYYWERSYLLAASVGLPYRLRVGASANYLRVEYAGGYSSLGLTALNLGVAWHAHETVALGVVARNVNRPQYTSGSQSLPLTSEISVSYIFSDAFSFFLTQHLEEKVRDRFFVGQEVNVSKEFSLNLGLATEPTEISGGFSLGVGSLIFDYGFRDNVYLGGTHRFGLRYTR
ncbi:MAG: hypothetical protein E4G91_07155 [Candidatus Zixiibacteriota bacterium]|nr:MAG: hypothetical protein E4G91_07155 [candidate division Zixibacteria bacterium]